MQEFLDALRDRTNRAITEKGATLKRTTKSKVLDFFANGAALRNADESQIERLFSKALNEDPLKALKIAFYIRDIRGGQGERRIFRIILKYLASTGLDEYISKNIEHVPFYGRWDDLYALFDTNLENEAGNLMKEQIIEDLNTDTPSLCAKWLKSENASSDETRRLARKTMMLLSMTPRDYRKTLSWLRAKVGIVEKKMSSGRWDEIDYERVPSRAAMIYKDAFMKHDPIGYQRYLDQLEEGKAKINASTLYPYDIVQQVLTKDLEQHEITVLDQQWKALPDYIKNESENSIAVIDTSASMFGEFWGEDERKSIPGYAALGLGAYLAERNDGPFKDKFITFSDRPDLIEITGQNIADKIQNMSKANWNGTTDLESVFGLILDLAIENSLSQDKLPAKLYIISDMEFDSCTSAGKPEGSGWNYRNKDVERTFFDKIAERYQKAGYKMPLLIFWNVDSRTDMVPMDIDDRGFQLVSGYSPVIFEALMQDEFLSPMDLVAFTIGKERYDRIII